MNVIGHECSPPVDAPVGEVWDCPICPRKWIREAASVPAHDAAVVPAHWERHRG